MDLSQWTVTKGKQRLPRTSTASIDDGAARQRVDLGLNLIRYDFE